MRNPSSSTANNERTKNRSKQSSSLLGLKRGPWTPEEDELLIKCINKEGEGKWRTLPKRAGLLRCGKSCRLRWMNYLRPSVKRGQITPDEEDLILRLHRLLGNRWSLIAGRIPGRTDNEIKNYWNTHLSKKLIGQGIDPKTHKPLGANSTPATASVSVKDGNKKSGSGNSSSSKMVTTTKSTAPSSGQNPNDMYHEEEEQVVQGSYGNIMIDANNEGQCSDGNHHHHTNLDFDDEQAGCYNVNLQQERSSHGLMSTEEYGDEMINVGEVEDGGVYSSFLNSLINDDMFL